MDEHLHFLYRVTTNDAPDGLACVNPPYTPDDEETVAEVTSVLRDLAAAVPGVEVVDDWLLAAARGEMPPDADATAWYLCPGTWAAVVRCRAPVTAGCEVTCDQAAQGIEQDAVGGSETPGS